MTGRQGKGKLRKSGSILWWSLVNCMRWPMGHFFYFRCDMQNAELFPTTLPPLPPTHTVVLLFFQICSWETSGGSFYGGNNFKTMFKTKQLLNMFKFWCKWGIRLVWWLATCTNRSHNQWSFKQWVGILLMTKIDRVCKNYLTPKIWEESHLRETFYGTLIFQQVVWFVLAAMLEGILLPSNMVAKTTFCLYLVKHLIVTLRCAVNVTTSSFQHFPWSLSAKFVFRKR